MIIDNNSAGVYLWNVDTRNSWLAFYDILSKGQWTSIENYVKSDNSK